MQKIDMVYNTMKSDATTLFNNFFGCFIFYFRQKVVISVLVKYQLYI